MTQEDIIAIFPLPNVVFFPKTHLPLHIFEPCYCEMIKDTIQNKQLIGMFLLQPGWQDDYYGSPPVYPIGCAGELVYVESLAEGKFNIVLRGLYRARAIETVQELPYRKARVEVLPEIFSEEEAGIQALRESLVSNFQKIAAGTENQEAPSVGELVDFAELVNSIAAVLQLEVEVKMQLLEEGNLSARASHLQKLLKKQVSVLEWTSHFAGLRPTDPTVN